MSNAGTQDFMIALRVRYDGCVLNHCAAGIYEIHLPSIDFSK